MNEDLNPTLSAEGKEIELSLRSFLDEDTSQLISDDEVAELDLVVFKNGGYEYTRKAYYSNTKGKFRSTLKIDDDVDIYFFANSRASLREDILREGRAWEDIRKELILARPDTVINNTVVLPMWGELKGVNISEHSVNNFTVQLLRSVASANVYFDLDEEIGLPFEPEVIYVYYGADRGFIAPEEENLTYSGSSLVGVKNPQSPSSMKTVKYDREYRVTQSSGFVDCIYLFENETHQNSQSDRRRTRLVVGGKLDGSSTLTYYPLHFSFGNEVLPITRNHQYKITVKSINSEGWENPDEAAEAVSVNLNYEVIEWNKLDTDIAVDGPDYLSISKREVTLYRHAGSKT